MSKSFIEVQFPVSKLSNECQKEKGDKAGQTLTGLGKWWGRKQLILVRAILLGILMPASDDPKKDMDIFLKILTMDEEGLWLRHSKSTKKKLSRNDFDKLSYKDKVKLCVRPEHIENLDENDWLVINSHLNTSASSFQELFNELGIRKFGHVTKAGDVFCGSGSIPFELSRLGCDTYASDLNPVAAMLTYTSLNILSQNDSTIAELQSFQEKVYTIVKEKIKSLGLETNEQGHQALSYLYCNETICPHCRKTVPLSPSWVISNKYKTIAKLIPNGNNFLIKIVSNVSNEELKVAKNGTIQNRKFVCPSCSNMFTISSLRGDKKTNDGTIYGLRKWNNEDIVPRDFDVFKERLYCIKYVDNNGKTYYCAPSKEDLMREEHVLKYIQKYFKEWQEEGYIPSDKIIPGEKTDELLRTRGWTHWHHLFNPRQLLLNGLLNKYSFTLARNTNEQIVGLLGVNKCSDFNSKLSAWQPDGGTVKNTFSEKALNTLFNYGVRSSINIKSSFLFSLKNSFFHPNSTIKLSDARQTERVSDIWITDPPYADAVNYHELTEFFLAWDNKSIKKIFPEWYANTKRELAVKGKGQSFNDSMVEVYSNLTNHMNDDGYQVVMFTHQDVKVWSDLVPVLIKSGLQVCQAWTIATETASGGLKEGKSSVQGTVNLILKKRLNCEELFSDELYVKVEDAILNQINELKSIDFHNTFTDQDYILCAYATALKVITGYDLVDINLDKEIEMRLQGKSNEIDSILNYASECAIRFLVPKEIKNDVWNKLSLDERFYIKTVISELHGSCTLAPIQELARTLAIENYRDYLGSAVHNKARLKTPSEFKANFLHDYEFGKSILRHVMMAIYESKTKNNLAAGKDWLRMNTNCFTDVTVRKQVLALLTVLSKMKSNIDLTHWKEDAELAESLYMSIYNECV